MNGFNSRAIGLAVLVVSVLHWMGCEQPATHPLPKGNVKGLFLFQTKSNGFNQRRVAKGCDATAR